MKFFLLLTKFSINTSAGNVALEGFSKIDIYVDFNDLIIFYRKDLEKQVGCGVVAHERLTEPRVTME